MDETVRDILLLALAFLAGWATPHAVDRWIEWTRPRSPRPSERFAQQEPLPVRRFETAEERATHHVIPLRGRPYELTAKEALEMSAEELQAIEARPGGAIILHPIRSSGEYVAVEKDA